MDEDDRRRLEPELRRLLRDRALWTFARKQVLGNEQDAEDLISEAITRTLNTFPGISIEVLRAYIRRTMYNAAIEVRRRRDPEELVDDPDAHVRDRQDDTVAQAVARTILRDILADLSEGQREVFDLHFGQGLTLREIAEIVGTSHESVARKIKRGRKKALRHLGKEHWA